ncbi:hypothetical protein CRM22_008522 [Opisthorchis felineus]|uniref:Uncharacterized protein n=1 Tax=Opisthorchis felineus TaxID=147828 RepID=A0A4S2LJ12_OPIFE|nr:hypothetical protein CRM22_008522 [Opisthorchis felineus]
MDRSNSNIHCHSGSHTQEMAQHEGKKRKIGSTFGDSGKLPPILATCMLKDPPCASSAVSAMFAEYHKCRDWTTRRGALKTMIFCYTGAAGMFCGTIGERTSLRMLKDSKFIDWLKTKNVSPFMFGGLHTQTFHSVSNDRRQITVDLYIDHFIPRLAIALRNHAQIPELTAKTIEEILVLPVFYDTPSKNHVASSSVVVDFVTVNRDLFAAHEIKSRAWGNRKPKSKCQH